MSGLPLAWAGETGRWFRCLRQTRLRETIVNDPATHTTGATFSQHFDADNPHLAEHDQRRGAVGRMVSRNRQHAIPRLTGDKSSICNTIEAVTAEIVSRGVYHFGGPAERKGNGPMDLRPTAPPAIPGSGFLGHFPQFHIGGQLADWVGCHI